MKYAQFAFFLFISFQSFSQKRVLRDTIINCDLQFSPFEYSGYKMNKLKKKKLIKKYEEQIKNGTKNYELSVYKFLKQQALEDSPYIIINTRDNHGKLKFYDEVMYLDSNSMKKLEKYSFNYLKKNKTKVELTCKVKYGSVDHLFVLQELIEIKLLNCDCYNQE